MLMMKMLVNQTCDADDEGGFDADDENAFESKLLMLMMKVIFMPMMKILLNQNLLMLMMKVLLRVSVNPSCCCQQPSLARIQLQNLPSQNSQHICKIFTNFLFTYHKLNSLSRTEQNKMRTSNDVGSG